MKVVESKLLCTVFVDSIISERVEENSSWLDLSCNSISEWEITKEEAVFQGFACCLVAIIALNECLSEGELIISNEVRVIVYFLEQLLGCIKLVENLFLLSLETSSIFLHAFVVIDFLEAWILPHTS